MPPVVRAMTEADVQAAAAVQVQAFGGSVDDAVARFAAGPRYTWRDGWVVDDDGEIRATATAIPARWWFRGTPYAISAVAGVAVRDVDRRRGFASDLMRAIVRADLAAGRPYSLLYPFQQGFYRRLGYGSVGLMHYWRIPVAHLPHQRDLQHAVRPLRPAEHGAIADLFARSLVQSAGGGLERSAAQWQQRWTRQDERWVVFDAGGAPAGYLAYRPVADGLEIRELVASHPEAERGLWAFLAAQGEQRVAISYLAPIDRPFWAALREPFMLDAASRAFVIRDVAALTMSFMARVVSVPAALEQRAFPAEVAGRLDLVVADPILAPAGQAWRVELDAGRARVESAQATQAPDGAVRCDVVTLSQVCSGALLASQARNLGLLAASDAATALLDRAFPPGPPFIHPADWF